MNSFGERVKKERVKKGYSLDELAKRAGYSSRTSIFRIEKNEINPTQSKIKSIANALDVSPSYLMGWVDVDGNFIEEKPTNQKPKWVKIPVLGTVIAGMPVEAIEDIIDYEEIPEEWTKKGDFFGLQIKGDSMAPRIEEKDVVIVRKQNNADTGDIVIALINGDEATCKRLKKVNGGIMLISNNPIYEPLFFSEKDIIEKPVTIIGKVVELRAKF